MVRSAVVPVTSLCVDESEFCVNVDDKESKKCENETGNETSVAAPALTCPRACGLCNATRPTRCEFPPEMVGNWHDGANVAEAEFQLTTAADRKSIYIVMVVGDAVAVKQRFHCIQWESTAPTSGKPPTQKSRFIFDEFLLVDEPTDGCKRRYACAWVLFKSASVIYFRLSDLQTWPFTILPSDPVDCSRFDSNARYRVLISRERRDLVTCHLPTNQLTNYSVTFGDVRCDATVVAEPEIRHRVRLTLADCTSQTASPMSFHCLDSMLAPPAGDVVLVTVIATRTSTSGAPTASPTLRTVTSADRVTKLRNVSLFRTDGRRKTTTPFVWSTHVQSTSPSSSSSSFFQPNAVYCWLFPRSTFPHAFHIFAGSQCDHVIVTSEAGRPKSATFVKKRVRWPRLLAADQPISPTSPELEIHASGRTRDSGPPSTSIRDTEQPTTDITALRPTTNETAKDADGEQEPFLYAACKR